MNIVFTFAVSLWALVLFILVGTWIWFKLRPNLNWYSVEYNKSKHRIMEECCDHAKIMEKNNLDSSFLLSNKSKYDEKIIERMFSKGHIKYYVVKKDHFLVELTDKFHNKFKKLIHEQTK